MMLRFMRATGGLTSQVLRAGEVATREAVSRRPRSYACTARLLSSGAGGIPKQTDAPPTRRPTGPMGVGNLSPPAERMGPTPSPQSAGSTGPGAANGASTSPPVTVIEVNESNFESVITRCPVPIVLDVYADWCKPCKQLAPNLEALVKKHKGRIILAKLNADTSQALAADLQVRSLPSVFGIFRGKLVDRFVGLVNDDQLKQFVNKLAAMSPVQAAPEPEEPMTPERELAEADGLLQQNKFTEAGEIYKRVYEELNKEPLPPAHLLAQCLAGLARCALASGHVSEAEQLVSLLKDKHAAEIKSVPQVATAVSFVEMALQAPKEEGGASVDETLDKLKERIAANSDDLDARYQLALKYFQLQMFEDAINEGLEILKRDKTWNEGAARQFLVKVFEAAGPGSDLAKKGRARMSNYLFA